MSDLLFGGFGAGLGGGANAPIFTTAIQPNDGFDAEELQKLLSTVGLEDSLYDDDDMEAAAMPTSESTAAAEVLPSFSVSAPTPTPDANPCFPGFIVEGRSPGLPFAAAPMMAPPPPPPPPMYGAASSRSPSLVPSTSPFLGYAVAPPPPPAKAPPPSFAEAIAATPLTLSAQPSPSLDITPNLCAAAHYIPAIPAAPHESILLRNSQGVFLLHTTAKPTPPYTPPTIVHRTSPPVSPLMRYALPPAAAGSPPMANFLGPSIAQASRPHSQARDPPQYSEVALAAGPPVGTSPYVGGIAFGGSTLLPPTPARTPQYGAAPPPPYAHVVKGK